MLRKETFKMKRKRKYLILMDLLKKADYNAKITEIESKIPSITWLATTAALTTAVENKIPDVINLVKKQTMKRKYQTLNLNNLLQLSIIHLLAKHLMQK